MKTQEWPDQIGKGLYMVWCEGCNNWHSIWTKPSEYPHPVWGFNGDLEKPTFTPSVRITWPENEKEHCCHFHIINGQMQFCGDCTHALNGQTKELQDVKKILGAI